MSAYADWLLWSRPALRGRVAFDSRFELFSPDDVTRLANLRGRVSGWEATARSYDVLVLDPADDGKLRDALVAHRLAQVTFADEHVVVLRRTA
jgi:hypothetical protein